MYRIRTIDLPTVIAADGTTADSELSEAQNGKIVGVQCLVPALVGTTTLTIAIKDANGATLYSKASIAEGAGFSAYIDANNFPLAIPVAGAIKATCTASNAQTAAAATLPVKVLIES
jgi:hypothetical protein